MFFFVMVGICRLVGKHLMATTHYPRLKIDKSIALDVVDVGIAQICILIVGEVMFKDKRHLLWREEIGVTKVAGAAYAVGYPIPITRVLKQAGFTCRASSSQACSKSNISCCGVFFFSLFIVVTFVVDSVFYVLFSERAISAIYQVEDMLALGTEGVMH